MDFIDKIRELSARIPKQRDLIQTEEATKNALIMPFISALGYDVFNPSEVTPELCADVGVKKGEKVDYAILRDGKPIILFECKHHAADLGKVHASQLYRYFSVTEARFGVLTTALSIGSTLTWKHRIRWMLNLSLSSTCWTLKKQP